MTADLVTFLRARYDEDEQTARAATAGPWWHNPGKQWLGPDAFIAMDHVQGEEFVGHGGPHPFTGCVAATGPADDRQSMADADHIARWHPVRVLAEGDAKRRLLGEYEQAAAFYAANRSAPAGEAHGLLTALRLMALPYADHPDYREEWRP